MAVLAPLSHAAKFLGGHVVAPVFASGNDFVRFHELTGAGKYVSRTVNPGGGWGQRLQSGSDGPFKGSEGKHASLAAALNLGDFLGLLFGFSEVSECPSLPFPHTVICNLITFVNNTAFNGRARRYRNGQALMLDFDFYIHAQQNSFSLCWVGVPGRKWQENRFAMLVAV
jgi:hypothetical protein